MNQIEALQRLKTLFPERRYHCAQEATSHDSMYDIGVRREFDVFIQPGYDGLCSLGVSNVSYEEAIQQLLDGHKAHMEAQARAASGIRFANDLERAITQIIA